VIREITTKGATLIVIGIDAHMRSHTVVAVDAGTGRQLDEVTVRADEAGHRRLLEFAARLSSEREWAIEDCRNLSRHLEAALLRAGERVRRVPPKLMSGARKSARTYGKSDPMRWPSPGRRCANRICRSRSWPGPSARSRWCSITART